tara:strand:+ start:1461 stop:1838 length:378 start_codon:yes stop_codon:yes gene_type:complete
MIPGFEDQTAPLSDYEKNTLMPVIVKGLQKRVGKNFAITNAEMCRKLKPLYSDVNGARIRKIINHIRIYDKVSCLVSTSKGYYVTKDLVQLNSYIESLNKRATAILAVAQAIHKQRNNLKPNLFD